MLQVSSLHKIYLAVGAIDFRCGIDSLAALCRNILQRDPMSGHIFIFRNRSLRAIKILIYDQGGYWLCHKRLSKGQFRYWPKDSAEVIALDTTQLTLLLANP